MGHRSNYVIVEGTGFSLYYSHWGAITVPEDLFWGPHRAMNFVRHQKLCRPDGWLDQTWAEGGALIDPVGKRLLLFGGDEIGGEVPVRRLYLSLLEAVWGEWRVDWANQGLADFVDRLAVGRELVSSDGAVGMTFDEPPCLAEEYPPEAVCSVRWPTGEIGLYPMSWDPSMLFEYGPRLLDDLAEFAPESELIAELSGGEEVLGGLHIDPASASLHLWQADIAPDIQRRAGDRWPDWTFTWHGDRFESQAELSDGRLTFAEPTQDELIETLFALLVGRVRSSGTGIMQDVFERLEEQGDVIPIYPWAQARRPQLLDREERRLTFDRAVAALGRNR